MVGRKERLHRMERPVDGVSTMWRFTPKHKDCLPLISPSSFSELITSEREEEKVVINYEEELVRPDN